MSTLRVIGAFFDRKRQRDLREANARGDGTPLKEGRGFRRPEPIAEEAQGLEGFPGVLIAPLYDDDIATALEPFPVEPFTIKRTVSAEELAIRREAESELLGRLIGAPFPTEERVRKGLEIALAMSDEEREKTPLGGVSKEELEETFRRLCREIDETARRGK